MADSLLTSDAAPTSEGASQHSATDPQVQAPGGDSTPQQPPTDGQTPAAAQGANDGNLEGGKGEKEGEKPTEAPEKYELKFTDGVTPDAEILSEFESAAKGLNLSQEDAQKFASLAEKMLTKVQTQQADSVKAMHTEWINGTKADKEFGGDKLPENLAIARKGMEKFGSPELRTLLDESGLGNHPEVIRVFFRVGKTISEDGFVGGKAAPAAGSDPKALYPNSNMN